MGIKTSDLDKYEQLASLLGAWSTQANNVGVKLVSVRVQVDGSFEQTDVTYVEEPPSEPGWQIQ